MDLHELEQEVQVCIAIMVFRFRIDLFDMCHPWVVRHPS